MLGLSSGDNEGAALTCRISSKSRPASFFMAETLPQTSESYHDQRSGLDETYKETGESAEE